MIVAGVGARASATADEVVAAVTDCCRRNGIEPSEVGILASLDRAATIDAVRAAAALLAPNSDSELHEFHSRLPAFHTTFSHFMVLFLTVFDLQKHAARCVTHSRRSLAATGAPSVAEAAALAAAGPDGMLLAPRVAYATVTVALAIGPGAAQP